MEKKDIAMKYSNEEITVVWKPQLCIHSKHCWKELSDVFKPSERPWVKIDAADSEKIVAQIDKCPSAALSYYRNSEAQETEGISTENIVEVSENGPLLVYGNICIKDKQGNVEKKNKMTAFCRCGQSDNKPYCDGTHSKINFRG